MSMENRAVWAAVPEFILMGRQDAHAVGGRALATLRRPE